MKTGKQSGRGLKPGINMADTGSVVNSVVGQVKFGSSRALTPGPGGKASNNMVAGNAALRHKTGRGR